MSSKCKTDLHKSGENVGDIALVRLDVFLQERVEVEQQELVDADRPRHDGDDQQPRLEALATAV